MATETVTLELPADVYDKLQKLAATQQQDEATLLARLVTTAYEQNQPASIPAFQTILENATDLGVADLADHHDQYLYELDRS